MSEASPERQRGSGEAWLSMREVCDLLGVSPATVRRWSDSGVLKAFTTPGGHRRFARSAVYALLPPQDGGRPPLDGLGLTTDHMTQAYRQHLSDGHRRAPSMADADIAALRHQWSEIVCSIFDAVDAGTAEDRRTAIIRGAQAAREHGRIAARAGAGPCENLADFLHWRAVFLAELASACRRKALDAAASCDVMLAATRSFDEFVPALLAGHEMAGADGGDSAAS